MGRRRLELGLRGHVKRLDGWLEESVASLAYERRRMLESGARWDVQFRDERRAGASLKIHHRRVSLSNRYSRVESGLGVEVEGM